MRKKIIPYNPKLKQLAKNLRNNSTLSEVLLWKHLKGKQMRGYDFHRQKPIDNYIVDFFCHDLTLALEIDGISHDGKKKDIYDRKRQKRLENLGIKFLRFNDRDVKKNVREILVAIEGWIDKNPPLTPPERGINPRGEYSLPKGGMKSPLLGGGWGWVYQKSNNTKP